MFNFCRWLSFAVLVIGALGNMVNAYEYAQKKKAVLFIVSFVSIPAICFAAWYLAVH